MRLFLKLILFLRPYWVMVAVALIAMMALSVLNIIPPYLFGVIVDNLVNQRSWGLIRNVLLLLIALHFVRAFVHFLDDYLRHVAAEKALFDLRTNLYNHLQKLSTRFFRDERTGEMMSRVVNDVDAVRDMFAHSASVIVVHVCTFLLIAAVMLWMHWKLALLVLLPVPIAATLTALANQRIRKLYRTARDKLASLNSQLQDSISGIEVIRAFAKEREEQHRFSRQSADYRDAMIAGIRLWAFINPGLTFLIGIGGIIVLWYGSLQILQDQLTVGRMVTFLTYLWRLYLPVNELIRENERVQRGLAAAERIFELFSIQPDIKDSPNAIRPARLRGSIELENVSFAYHPERLVLEDVNLSVHPGEVLGIAGPSGAGKTTLVSLLLRLYDPTEGKILLDGHDLRDLQLEWLRNHIGIVHQDTFLFNTTIAENIAYGKPDATLEEIFEAARVANIYDFIMSLPKGFDTIVGERGVKLSGGEKQRVAIARAVLKNPPILILDEATSNVDAESEQLIHDSLERLLDGRTVIIIAHRLSTLRFADRIIVLDSGRIVEEGTHAHLVTNGGLYARLWLAQSELWGVRP